MLKLKFAGRTRGTGIRGAVAVDGDRIQVLAHTADADVAEVAVHGLSFHPGQANQQVGGITGEIAEGVRRNDTLNSRRRTLQGDGLRVALAFTGNAYGSQGVDL